jgi:peptidoglycan/LPS O-acetylase OafA/YrhL
LYLFFIVPIYLLFASRYLSLTKIIGSIFGSTNIAGVNHLWYIPYILFCYLITPVLSKVDEKLKNKSNIVFVLSIILVLCINQVVITLYVKYFTAAWINCYLLGFFIAKLIKRRLSLNIIIILLLPFCIVLNIFKILFFGNTNIFIEQYTHVVLGVSLFLFLLLILQKINCDNKLIVEIFNLTDRYSYDVYITHHIYILGPFSVMALSSNKLLNIIILYAMIISTAFILNQLRNQCQKIKTHIMKKIIT